eukprot:11710678-Alexandrium_andersonii.AAC.1
MLQRRVARTLRHRFRSSLASASARAHANRARVRRCMRSWKARSAISWPVSSKLSSASPSTSDIMPEGSWPNSSMKGEYQWRR